MAGDDLGGKKTGVDSVVEMLALMDEESRKKLLTNVAARDPKLAATIEERLFQFSDLSRLSQTDLQIVLKSVRTELLALAMKILSDDLRSLIFANLSTRAAEILREEISGLGPRRVSDVSAAQAKIIEIVKTLGSEGKIKINS